MNGSAIAILIVLQILITLAIAVYFHSLQERTMGDLSKLNTSVSNLSTAVDGLIASQASDQPGIDAATTAVDAITAKVTAATTPPPSPTA